MNLRASFGLAAALAAVPVVADASTINGAQLSLWWAIPFAGILLSIALGPLLLPTFWHHHFGKVSLFWALCVAVPLVALFGADAATGEIAHAMLGDYLPFIIFVGSLYIVAGGIHIRGSFVGKPLTNCCFLGIGAICANLMGTTGAAMLLIRPLIDANKARSHQMHTYIFFLFIVANIGGSLTPLGDPPLFLGFLRGVNFFWTLQHMIVPMGTAVLLLLAVYFLIDTWAYQKDKDAMAALASQEKVPFAIEGKINLLFLACLVGGVLLSGFWKPGISYEFLHVHFGLESMCRDAIYITTALLSLALTARSVRQANQFGWAPILEVAKLFFGIFMTIVPVLGMLRAGSSGAFAPLVAIVNDANGNPINPAYFWFTGMLSSFLDNAPTYLAFFNLAGGDPTAMMTTHATTLMAISMGAVFMGANSYIGNAPNFMVVSIVQERGIRMPSFFGYIGWALCILIPTFGLLTVLYLM